MVILHILGNRMQVIFTNIDEKDPSMQFYFFLQVQDGSRQYIGKSTGISIFSWL